MSDHPICGQCGKPAVCSVGGTNLCVEHYSQFAQAQSTFQTNLMRQTNFLMDEMEAITGLRGIGPRYQIPQPPPTVKQGPVTLNHIRVDRSVIGAINTANVKTIDVVMSQIQIAGNEQLAQALGAFTEAVLKDQQLSVESRDSVIEQISFLTTQYMAPEQRKPSIIKSVLASIPIAISAGNGLVTLWTQLEPILRTALGQ